MSARAQSAPQRGVQSTSELRGSNGKSPSERLVDLRPHSSSTQRSLSIQSNGAQPRFSRQSSCDSVRQMRAASSESAMLRRQNSSSRLRTPSSDRYKSEERLKSDKARAKTAELVYLRQTNPRPTPSRRRPRTGDTPMRAASSDAVGLNFSSPTVPPPKMRSLSTVKMPDDDTVRAAVDPGHESPTTIAGLASTSNTSPSAAGSSEGDSGQTQMSSDESQSQHSDYAATVRNHPGTMAVADKVAARKLGLTSPKTAMDGESREDTQLLPQGATVPTPTTLSMPLTPPQRSDNHPMMPPPPPPTSTLATELDAPLTPHLPPESFMSPMGRDRGVSTSRRNTSSNRNESISRNTSKQPRPSSTLHRSVSESRLLFSPPSSSSNLELAAVHATEPRTVFFPSSLSLDPLDTVAEAKAEIQRLYASELARLKWTVTGFGLYRCVSHGESAGGATAVAATVGTTALVEGENEDARSNFGKRKSQSFSGSLKTSAAPVAGGTGAAAYCYSTSSEALSKRVVISQLPGFYHLPMFALKAPLPEAIRERVGGGFQIKARDPVSHALLGMDRYLKRYPPEGRYLDVRILPLRAAATTLAAAARGRAARRRASALRLIQRTIAAQKEARRAKREHDAAVTLQGVVRLKLARRWVAVRRATRRRSVVALMVQPIVRGKRVRRLLAIEKSQLAAAVRTQRCARLWLARRRLANARRMAEAEEAARLVREMKQLEVARSQEEALLVSERFRERAGRGLCEQEARAQALAIRRIVRDDALTPQARLEIACVRAFRVPTWRGVVPDVLLSSELLYHECPALQGMPLVPWQVILDAATAAAAATTATEGALTVETAASAAASSGVEPAEGVETKGVGSTKKRSLSRSRPGSQSNLTSPLAAGAAAAAHVEVKLNDVPCARCASTTAAYVAPYGLWQHVRSARPHRSRLDKARRSRSTSKLEAIGSKSSGSFNKEPSRSSSASKTTSKIPKKRAEVSAESKSQNSDSRKTTTSTIAPCQDVARESKAREGAAETESARGAGAAAPVGAALGLCHSCARTGHGVLASAPKRTLTFNRAIKFGGRSAVVHLSSSPTLALLARMLTDNPLPIQVEGHTNNDASLDHVPFLKAAQQGQKPGRNLRRSTSASTMKTNKRTSPSRDDFCVDDQNNIDDGEDNDNDDNDANEDIASKDAAATPYHLSQLRADAVCRDLLDAAAVYHNDKSEEERGVTEKGQLRLPQPWSRIPQPRPPRESNSFEHNHNSQERNNEETVGDLAAFLFPVGVGGQRLKARAKSAKLTEPQAQRNRRVEVHFLDLA